MDMGLPSTIRILSSDNVSNPAATWYMYDWCMSMIYQKPCNFGILYWKGGGNRFVAN